METIVCLIPNDEHLALVKRNLEKAGPATNKVDILFRPAGVWQRLSGHQKVRSVFKWAAAGALIGLGVGAIYGLPASAINCFMLNCSFQTGAVLWVLISLFWVVAGGIIGAIVGLDKLEDDLYSYVEGVRRGEALFVVDTVPEQAQQIVQILREEQGTVIHDVHQKGTER
jgi:hypothetical protein